MSESLEKSKRGDNVISLKGDFMPREEGEPLPKYKDRIGGLIRAGEESIKKGQERLDQRKQELGKAELLIGDLENAQKERVVDPRVLKVLTMMRANKEKIEEEVGVLEAELARLQETKEQYERLLRTFGAEDTGEKRQMEA